MAGDRITRDVLALPLADRISLAQALWDSIDDELIDTPEDHALTEAVRRARELRDDPTAGVPWEDVLEETRSALGCK